MMIKKKKKILKEENFSGEQEEEIRNIIREELPYIFYRLYLRRKSWTR